ncbi:hypothetical protein Z517_03921 [Fonsecaea pedrosoi CBS 271.37]|uniref:MARVEL domain-containing protein n=1 Tax=Fonsecaea pedrosoi CBS 271.37 TaxID=1442368 RepID=A0A0D2GJA5_9EURO|nr:uncharacterized protein Z517_03921 [Fonsecaea pedrosoi CBS 271.37]KIW80898.1 hypothetical protein Z517_03921 [Fonsecaea pedrosoi CBS 271.37]
MHAHTKTLSTSSITPALTDREIPVSPRYTYARQRSLLTIPPGYRVTIRIITVLLAIGVGAALVYTIIIKNATEESRFLDAEGNNRPAWPPIIWTQPTIVLLTAAGYSCLFDLTALVMTCAEIHRSELWAIWLESSAFTVSIAVWIAGLAYAKTWNSPDSSSSDLWSWSCSHQGIHLNYGNDSVEFKSLCRYMDFVFCGGIVVCALQFVNMVLFWIVRNGERVQKEISKRNAYARKHILGSQDTVGQDE